MSFFLLVFTAKFVEGSTFVHSLKSIFWKVTTYQSVGTQIIKAPPLGNLWFHNTDKQMQFTPKYS